jgi:formylglycine-generating enzyme required for sulfatase activity
MKCLMYILALSVASLSLASDPGGEWTKKEGGPASAPMNKQVLLGTTPSYPTAAHAEYAHLKANNLSIPESLMREVFGSQPQGGARQGGESWASATPITFSAGGTYTDSGTTVSAVNDVPVGQLPPGLCNTSFFASSSFGGGDVFYTFTLPAAYEVDASTCNNASYDSCLGIFDSNHNLVAVNDDGAGCTGFSSVIDPCCLSAGSYYVVVDGYGTATGNYTLSLNFSATACGSGCPPIVCDGIDEGEPNNGPADFGGDDTYGSIECGTTVCGTTFTDDAAQTRDTDWFELTLTEISTLTINTQAELFDPLLFVIDNAYNILYTANDFGWCEGESIITDRLLPGTYYIWMGHNGFTGVPEEAAYSISLGCQAYIVEDPCIDQVQLYCGDSVTGTTVDGYNYVGNAARDNIYALTVDQDGPITLSLCTATDYDSFLRIYDGCPTEGGVEVAYNDNFCGQASEVTVNLTAGTYWVVVEGNGTAVGHYLMEFHCDGDNQAIALANVSFNNSGSLAPGWTTRSNSTVLTTPWAPIFESGSDYAVQTSHAAFSTPRTEWLISPIYNLTGYQDINLGYMHAYTHAGSTATVKYSTNGGVAWQNLTSYSTTTNGSIVTNIAAWANGQANVRFAFVFTGTFVTGGASWRIDDFFLDGVATAPVVTAPVPSQPPASWNTLSGSVGCTWQHPLGVSGADLQVRIDANGDGDYLDGEAENWSGVADQPNASPLTFTTSVSYQQSGTQLCYEFRARSGLGFWGYSGSAGQEGIADDWYVRIVEEDTVPPTESVLFVGGSTNDSVTLMFSPTTEAHFARYEVRCSSDSLVDESDLLWTDAQDPALSQIDTYQTTVTGLTSGTAWYFRMWAVDLAGNRSPTSNRVRKVTEGSQVSPVMDLQAELQGGDVLLIWTAPTTDIYGQSPVAIEAYQVHASIDASFTPSPSTLIGTTSVTSFLIANPGGDIKSFFKVVVVGAGPGQPFPVPMTLVPAGSFIMGQAGVATPEHEVTLTHDFLLGTTEVTNQQFREVAQWAVDSGYATVSGNQLIAYGVVLLDMSSSNCEIAYSEDQFSLRRAPGAGGWGFINYATYDPSQHPVKMVSWSGAACYCDWLSLMNGLPAYYGGNWEQIPSQNSPYTATGYRLPTEAEWEFAAQCDDERTYPWGEAEPTCQLANSDCIGWTSLVGTHPTGASALGLQDMAGNVWEWSNDWWASYASSPQLNPVGPASGGSRTVRGGYWNISPAYLPCALRDSDGPSTPYHGGGFRLCRTYKSATWSWRRS